jgi:hypothetical protein
MSEFIEKGPTDCWPWQGDPDEAPSKEHKMACDNSLCCNPRHIVAQNAGEFVDKPVDNPPDSNFMVYFGTDNLLELLDQSVENLKADIGRRDNDVPVVSDEWLDRLEEAEINGKTRQSAIDAIDAERKTR